MIKIIQLIYNLIKIACNWINPQTSKNFLNA